MEGSAIDAGAVGWDECTFLLGRALDKPTLDRAAAAARLSAKPVHRELLDGGTVTTRDYVRHLARSLGVDHAFSSIGMRQRDFHGATLVDGTELPPSAIAARTAALRASGLEVVLFAGRLPQSGESARQQAERLDLAAMGHHRRSQAASARSGTWLWQKLVIVVVAGMSAGMAAVDLPLAYFVLTCIAAGPFALIVVQRLAVLMIAARKAVPRPKRQPRTEAGDPALPVYTVLVPLFREADVLPDLIRALARLDYPAGKLDILIVLEAVDTETQAAAMALGMPDHMRLIIVPDGQPRTKPKALNFALQFARGSYVTVYDAEDVPEPAQLLDAVAVFRRAGNRRLGCLQARLNIYNRRRSWLTGQFTLEYSALFDGLLPALLRLGLPLPLGGTSNHFPRAVLDELGGWDPHNVTEDADLGIRLARSGYEIRMLASTTWEEAPAILRDWLPQRTRWLKGWMQTYLVHMRRPFLLLRELGAWRFFGFNILIGGFLLSALMHPLFYVVVAVELAGEAPFAAGSTTLERSLQAVALFNLAAGFVAATAMAALHARRRGFGWLLAQVPLMPAYWLLVSAAAYRALWQLAWAPHRWEKTRHGARRRVKPPAPGPRKRARFAGSLRTR